MEETPRVEEAVAAIESFLHETAGGTNKLRPRIFEQLSTTIEAAKSARCVRVPSSRSYSEIILHKRYQANLEQLRLRLSEIEMCLIKKRNEVLGDRARITQTIEWHTSLNKTR